MEETLNQYKRNTHKQQKYITLIHHNKSTQKIAKRCKKHKYNIVYTINNTLHQGLLIDIATHNTKKQKYTSTGVYKLNCNDLLNSISV